MILSILRYSADHDHISLWVFISTMLLSDRSNLYELLAYIVSSAKVYGVVVRPHKAWYRFSDIFNLRKLDE